MSLNRRQKEKIIFLGALALAFLSFLIFKSFKFAEAQPDLALIQGNTQLSALPRQVIKEATAVSVNKTAHLPQEKPAPSSHAQAQRQLFEKPQFIAEDTYAADSRPLTWSTGCEKIPEEQRFLRIDQHTASLGLSGEQKRPHSAAHIVNYNQYFTLNDAYLQLSVNWNFDSPASFQVVALSTPAPDDLENLEPIAIDSYDGKPVSQTEALQIIERTEQAWQSQGAVEGARTIKLSPAIPNLKDPNAAPMATAEYRNGRLVGYIAGNTTCLGEQETIVCHCK